MGLNLTAEAQAALDLAKRAVPEGGELDAGLVMAALYQGGALKELLPEDLGKYLLLPQVLRGNIPEKVPVARPLQPVLARFAEIGSAATTDDLLRALLESDPGRAFLLARGMPEPQVDALLAALHPHSGLVSREQPQVPAPSWRASPQRRQVIDALSSFGRTLTATEPPERGVYRGGMLDRVVRSLVVALSGYKSRSAVIVGPPGTGKSAAVYELARRLYHGDPGPPAHIRDLDIFELSPSFLRSGASMVGQYDERVKSLIQALEAHPKIVLFVDEVHSLLKSGLHERDPFSDANEAFKAPLAAGSIACIGCTTLAEYHHYIEPDRALRDRFPVIRLEEPSAEESIEILKSKRPRMEAYFSPPPLRISDAVLARTVELAQEYLLDRCQPRKSIQLLDRACAYCVTASPRPDEVSEQALWQALEDMVGHSVVRPEGLREDQVLERLRAKILGQDETLRGIARAFIAGIGGWARQSTPRGVWFFCGPTGVGKTETAVLLGQMLGGGKEALVRVNCNTLQGSGRDSGPAVNVLLGAPPGFVGYVRGQGGVLSRVRDEPESIILFDEIEKADPGVAKLLLQILDDGRVEDNEGNTLDFHRAFIVFTTNAGASYEAHRPIGFENSFEDTATPTVDVEAVKNDLRELGYGEEFFGRIDHWFVFQGLTPQAAREVIAAQLARLQASADVRGYALDCDPPVVERLASIWQPRFGVRHLVAVLRNRIVEQLAVAEAQGELKGVSRIRLQVLALPKLAPGQELAGLATRELAGETLVINVA